MLAELVEIQMSIARATQQEALQAPQPGVDYGQRIATVARSVRLTLLLKNKLSQQVDERRKAAAKREAAQEDFHDLRVKLAAAYEVSEDNEEINRRVTEVREQLERPEVVELIEASRAEVAVAALCRRWGFPVRVEQWLEMADEAMEQLGFLPSDEDDPPADPPGPRSAGVDGRKPRPPDTG